MKKSTNIAQKLGYGLAILQHNFDKFFAWGFEEMKKTSEKKTKNSSKFTGVLKKIGGFLGVMGEEYYRKYEELKKKE